MHWEEGLASQYALGEGGIGFPACTGKRGLASQHALGGFRPSMHWEEGLASQYALGGSSQHALGGDSSQHALGVYIQNWDKRVIRILLECFLVKDTIIPKLLKYPLFYSV